jgi:hypothetical protein
MTEKKLSCTLVVPARNEESRIGACLREVGATPLPEGAYWREWIICDDASTDGTIVEARKAAASMGFDRLSIRRHENRVRKPLLLQGAHRGLLEHSARDEAVIAMDADVKPEPQTFRALLQPFLDDPKLAVVWGDDRPKRSHRRQRPATFQMELKAAIARAAGPTAARAYGRLFAYRLDSLRDFEWVPHTVADDVQLAWFARAHNLPVWSAWRATVQVTPAETLRDFYIQTYREKFKPPFRDADLAPDAHERTFAGPAKRAILTAGASAVAHDPLGAVAYLMYRIAAEVIRRTHPDGDATSAAVARSTKLPWGEAPGAAGAIASTNRRGDESPAAR